jgi:tetratricopeptide (TPR) repeat protein
MANSEIFVGRKEELNEFTKALEDPRGQAIIVVGNRGMGKTWLVNRMAKLAGEHHTLKCGFVRYEVTPTDSPDSTMAIMMDNAFEAANTEPGSFDNVPERKRQWLALFKTFVPKGEQLAELMASLRRDPAKDTRQQFLERLELISRRMPKDGRAIFIVDPEKYMAKDSDQTWAIVVKNLPEKIKLIFAQRTEDALVGSEVIDGLDNVVRIPDKILDTLSEEDVDELVDCRKANLPVSIPELQKILKRYEGHPYAVGAALDLVEQGTKLEELPKKAEPTKFAELQWKKVCETGVEAMKLFEAYAILEVAVPDDVVEYVSKLDATTKKRLQNDKYLRGLLRDEAGGRRIYHSILADYIVGQMSEEKKKYHKRAAKIYRGKLKRAKKEKTKPDELSAVRLSEHVLGSEGKEAFVLVFVSECYTPLFSLGLFDEAISLSERALEVVTKDSEEQAAILGNLGIVYHTRGKLDLAEETHTKSLGIYRNIGLIHGIADQCGNLGLIYRKRGELDKAEEMYITVLDIEKQLGRPSSIVNVFTSLGVVYEKKEELGKAEGMYEKALGVAEEFGLLDMMAIIYGNLGVIYRKRGELGKAEKIIKRAIEISEKLGDNNGMAKQYGNLGNIYLTKGELDKAEEMYKRSLKIAEKIGIPEEIAITYTNLGTVYEQKGNYKRAREYWEKGLNLFKKIGMLDEAKNMEGWLEKIKEK